MRPPPGEGPEPEDAARRGSAPGRDDGDATTDPIRAAAPNPSTASGPSTSSGPSTLPTPAASANPSTPPGTSSGSSRRPAGHRSDREHAREQAECFVAEDELLADVRARSAARGVLPVGTGAAAALSFLATATGARAVVEIGTGLGLGTVSLLRGMPAEGLLTSIDVDAEAQRLTRAACAEAGFGPGRLRMITGRALDVLPRLSDGVYDLVVVDAVTTEYPRYLAEAVRLLRRGGVVVLDNAMWNGSVADPARRDAIATALRDTGRAVREDERLVPLMLPLSDGLLCAAVR